MKKNNNKNNKDQSWYKNKIKSNFMDLKKQIQYEIYSKKI